MVAAVRATAVSSAHTLKNEGKRVSVFLLPLLPLVVASATPTTMQVGGSAICGWVSICPDQPGCVSRAISDVTGGCSRNTSEIFFYEMEQRHLSQRDFIIIVFLKSRQKCLANPQLIAPPLRRDLCLVAKSPKFAVIANR